MKKIKLKILDMHCTGCAINIDGDLEDTEGVSVSKTNYAKQVCIVEFDDQKITTSQIVEIVKKTGYSAKPLSNN